MRRRLTEEELLWIWTKAGGRCTYGHRQLSWSRYGERHHLGWEVDHGNPITNGGTDDLRNMRVACWACNRFKGPMTASQWRYRISTYYGDACPRWRVGNPIRLHP